MCIEVRGTLSLVVWWTMRHLRSSCSSFLRKHTFGFEPHFAFPIAHEKLLQHTPVTNLDAQSKLSVVVWVLLKMIPMSNFIHQTDNIESTKSNGFDQKQKCRLLTKSNNVPLHFLHCRKPRTNRHGARERGLLPNISGCPKVKHFFLEPDLEPFKNYINELYIK